MLRRLIILLLIVGCENSTESKDSCSMEIPFSWCFSDCECRSIIQNTGIDTLWSFGYTLTWEQKFYSYDESIAVFDSVIYLSTEVNSDMFIFSSDTSLFLLPDSTLIHSNFNFNDCGSPDSTRVSTSNIHPSCSNP